MKLNCKNCRCKIKITEIHYYYNSWKSYDNELYCYACFKDPKNHLDGCCDEVDIVNDIKQIKTEAIKKIALCNKLSLTIDMNIEDLIIFNVSTYIERLVDRNIIYHDGVHWCGCGAIVESVYCHNSTDTHKEYILKTTDEFLKIID